MVDGHLVLLVVHTLVSSEETEDSQNTEIIRIISARKADNGQRIVMKTRPVKYQLDLNNLPSLTAKQSAELAAVAAQTDSQIDKSDMAQLSPRFWKTEVRNPLYKPTKQSTTVRLDSDVLQWLKSNGSGYQTRLNAILRNEMLRETAH
jgi:uncharacterized protein (DUF4415 family)